MAPRQWTYLARTAQFEATPRESDPRSTAGAQGAPGRIRHARRNGAGNKKPAAPGAAGSIKKDVVVVFAGEFFAANVFAEDRAPASTVSIVRAEVRVVLRVVAIFMLTLFRRVCLLGRNLITVFSTVNNLTPSFFRAGHRRDLLGVRTMHSPFRQSARATRANAFAENKKTLVFCCFDSRRNRAARHRQSAMHARMQCRERATKVLDGTENSLPARPDLRVAQVDLRKTAQTFSGSQRRRRRAARKKKPASSPSRVVGREWVRRSSRIHPTPKTAPAADAAGEESRRCASWC